MSHKLPRDFYRQDTLVVAQALIGMHLVREVEGVRRTGRIVETEAYQGPEDLAAHSARGLTARNATMFGAPGHAYVYLIYGIWNCVNVVTRETGVPHAVLIRALEPIAHLDAPTHGPGLLCRAMDIDRQLNGVDLLGKQLWIEVGRRQPLDIISSPRIGVNYAGEWAQRLWRFHDRNSAYVSSLSSGQRKRLLAPELDSD